MVDPAVYATLSLLVTTASAPLYWRGVRVIVDADPVTWSVLVRHLRLVGAGLFLTTGAVVLWMAPRLPDQFGGFTVLHAVAGLQAYALLAFALTGIVPILREKWRADLYRAPGRDVSLDDLHEDVDTWRKRLRVGVLGYAGLWVVAWLLGVIRYLLRYWL